MGSAKNLILNIMTFIIVAALAGSTAYFFLKSQDKNIKTPTSSTPVSPQSSEQSPQTTTPSAPTSELSPPASSLTKPSATSNQPSNPSQSYTVGPGETLSGISQKLNMNWTRLTEVNNLTDGNSIKEQQVLIVPTYDEKTKKLFVEYQTDVAKATQLQDQSTKLTTSPYLDPTATAKSDSIGVYGLTANDIFTFVSQNELQGTAIVNVAHNDKQYLINLIQPLKKGKDGIWAISQIIPA